MEEHEIERQDLLSAMYISGSLLALAQISVSNLTTGERANQGQMGEDSSACRFTRLQTHSLKKLLLRYEKGCRSVNLSTSLKRTKETIYSRPGSCLIDSDGSKPRVHVRHHKVGSSTQLLRHSRPSISSSERDHLVEVERLEGG